MSLFVGILALLGNFGAHLTRLECRFSIYIKYKNVIRLEIFSRKILLHMTNSLHCTENTRNRFAELKLKILLLLLLLLSSLKLTFSGLKYVIRLEILSGKLVLQMTNSLVDTRTR